MSVKCLVEEVGTEIGLQAITSNPVKSTAKGVIVGGGLIATGETVAVLGCTSAGSAITGVGCAVAQTAITAVSSAPVVGPIAATGIAKIAVFAATFGPYLLLGGAAVFCAKKFYDFCNE